MYNETFYNRFRTRTFIEIFPNVEEFKMTYSESALGEITDASLQKLYFLLLGRYGSSHISYSSEDLFKAAICGIIFEYGPSWQKRLDLQKQIRELEDYTEGSRALHNHSYNPSTDPSTLTDQILETIDDQNVTKYKKAPLEGLSLAYSTIVTDVTEAFLGKFRRLFVKVLMTGNPLLYATYEDNMIQEDD